MRQTEMLTNKRMLHMGLLVVCALLLFVPLQENIGAQLANMLAVTLSVYALLRGLNAVISTAQGTEVSIEPMGVGMTLTPGEFLDPLNDLIEQVSTVLLLASASIGIQKIILSLTDIAIIRWGALALVVVMTTLIASKRISPERQQTMLKLIVFVTILRLVVPAMVITSGLMQSWLETDRQESVTVLISTEKDIQELNNTTSEKEEDGWFANIASKFDMSELFNSIEEKADNAVSAAVYLLAEFVLVFIFIPVMFLFFAYRLLTRQFM
jgi:hypothetical protein